MNGGEAGAAHPAAPHLMLIRSGELSAATAQTSGMVRSAAIFEDLRAQWASTLGPERLRELEGSLRTMTPHGRFRLDVPGWFGA